MTILTRENDTGTCAATAGVVNGRRSRAAAEQPEDLPRTHRGRDVRSEKRRAARRAADRRTNPGTPGPPVPVRRIRSASGPTAASALASMLNRASGNSSSRSASNGIGSVPPIRARRTCAHGSAAICPPPVGHPVQGQVVERDQLPVGGGVHVGFQVAEALVVGPAEGRHGVLQAGQIVDMPAAVGERPGWIPVQVGRHGGQSDTLTELEKTQPQVEVEGVDPGRGELSR